MIVLFLLFFFSLWFFLNTDLFRVGQTSVVGAFRLLSLLGSCTVLLTVRHMKIMYTFSPQGDGSTEMPLWSEE